MTSLGIIFIFCLIGLIDVSFRYLINGEHSREKKERVKKLWIYQLMGITFLIWIFIIVLGIFKYMINLFGNLISSTLMFIGIELVLFYELKKIKKKNLVERKISNSFLSWLVIIFLFLLILNFNSLMNKVEFTLEGDRILTDNLEKGDILFGYANFLDSFVPGRWSHVGIYVGKENGVHMVIDALKPTIVKRTLEDFMETPGLSLGRVEYLTDEEKDIIVEFVESKVGGEFSQFYMFKKDDGKFYCSELIWTAYQQVGVDVDSNPGFSIKTLWGVSPQELYDDNDTKIYKIIPSLE